MSYSQSGANVFTICVQGRRPLLGEVVDGGLRLNAAGEMVHRWWQEFARRLTTVVLDAFIVVPNHAHGIVFLEDLPRAEEPTGGQCQDEDRACAPAERLPLSKVIQWLKTMTTNEYIRRVGSLGWPPFKGKHCGATA